MFKKSILFTSLFAGLILLWGCPYTSIVPLGKPIELIRPELIGSWMPENELNQENPTYYTIEKFDTVRYAIAHYQYNADAKDYSIKNYVAHTTSLEGLLFLNMNESGTQQYSLHRIDLVPSGFNLFEVTDNIDEKFETSADMQEFFIKNMRLSFFYNKDEVSLIRK
jgi:hypothetical protein